MPNSSVSRRCTALHALLARRVVDHIRSERLPVGHHITEESLEPVLGTSRSPIRGALADLARRGVLASRPPRRGLFVAVGPEGLSQVFEDPHEPAEERGYLALAHDRLAGALPEVLSEAAAMSRYGLTRERVRRILGRAAKEGWIEQRAGNGWSFLPMIDGPEALAESYALRRSLEPDALRMAGFGIDDATLARLRGQQEALAAGGYRDASRGELFNANASFHEVLARSSGNRFVHQVIVRQNQLRRLLEYRLGDDRVRVGHQCEEHLAILAAIEAGDRERAAVLLSDHLAAACTDKLRQLDAPEPRMPT